MPFDLCAVVAATALLRHPDLLAPVADLHRAQLHNLLDASPVDIA